MQDTAQLIAIILLVAFGIERVTAAAGFALGPAPAADDVRGQRRRKLLLTALSGALALAVVEFAKDIRIIAKLEPQQTPPLLDYFLTWLVIFAGSDRVKEFLGGAGAGSAPREPKKEVPPIKIVVDEGISARVA